MQFTLYYRRPVFMNEEFMYSLCLALPNLYGSNPFYRIADYNLELREFNQASYEHTMETPIRIDSKDDGDENEVELRKWKPIDEKNQMSFNEQVRFGYIYEVLFLDKIIHQPLSDKQLRQILFEGIHLPKGIKRYFLLVLDVTIDSYRVLLCDKNAFEFKDGKYYIEKQVRDLKNTVTDFELLHIYNDQLISTEKLKDKYDWYTEETRYFYNSTIVPESSEKFKLRGPENYTIGFFAQYLKSMDIRNKYPKQIRSNLVEELRYIENNYDLTDQFFAPIIDDYKSASNVFRDNLSNLIDYIKHADTEKHDVFLEILERDEDISKTFEDKIEEKWMQKFNQNILEKENELSALQDQYNEKYQEVNVLLENFNKAQVEYKRIDKELKDLIEQKSDIEKQIEKELNDFQNNIVEHYKISALSFNEQREVNSNQGIIEYSSSNLENVQDYDIKNMNDIFEGIKYNLENFMEEMDAGEYAMAILAILKTNKLLILPEFQSEGIANAISLISTGKPVKTISILNDKYDLNYVINQVDKDKESYILIKGHLDMFNETSITTLINQSKNKKIIFTINDEKSLNLFSNNLWNYCVYLNLIDAFDMAEELYWKQSNQKIDLIEYHATQVDVAKDLKDRFMQESIFTRYVQEELLYIMNIYNGLYKEIINPFFQLTSLKEIPLNHQILAVNRDRVDELENYLIRIGIEPDVLKFYK